MRKLLSIIALSCAMALAFGAYAPGARAAALTNGVLALRVDQPSLVEKARYRCWWRHGYRHCGYSYGWRRHYGWRHHRGYGYGYGWRHRLWHNHHGYGWRHRYWRRHYGWRHRYWHYRRYYGGEYRAYRNYDTAYRNYDTTEGGYRPYPGYYGADGSYHLYRRHYYYNSYSQPYYKRRYAPTAGGYCIGLCWW
jgi:hypothetical protein